MLAETAPSCNDCVATIVARPFTTTVRGRNQPSGDEKRVLFPRIQESGGVSGLHGRTGSLDELPGGIEF